jgi:HK97 family phage major capsid protein
VSLDIESLRGLDAYRAADAELRARLTELDAEAAGQPFNEAQRVEFEEISGQEGLLARVNATIDELAIRDAVLTAAARDPGKSEGPFSSFAVPNVHKAPENVYDLSAYRQRANSVDDLPGLYRDGAMRVIDKASFPTVADQAKAKENVAALVAKHGVERNGWISRRIIGTDDPVYRAAWTEYVAGGRDGMTGRHLAVMQTYSDPDGGVAIPITIDPTFINISSGAAAPFRQTNPKTGQPLARIETITTKSWQPVTTAGVVATYGVETATATESAIADVSADPDGQLVTPVRAKVFVKFTAEYQEDYGSAAIAAALGGLIRDSKDVLECEKYVIGDGSNEPEGIIWAIDDEGSSVVTSATFDLDALDGLEGAVGPRFRNSGRASHMANLAILQKYRQLGTNGQPSNSIYDPLSATLHGYPAFEASFMDDAFGGSGDNVDLFGDFQQFVIVDRLGLSTEYIAQVFDGGGDPLGQRGIYARWRNTSKVLVFNAFRLLQKT